MISTILQSTDIPVAANTLLSAMILVMQSNLKSSMSELKLYVHQNFEEKK